MTSTVSNLKAALNEWKDLLGPRMKTGLEVENNYKFCTFPLNRNIPAALVALTKEEIISIVLIANKYLIPLLPISTGNNWGYGSANPIIDDCIILDLSCMDKIIDFDEELGVVTIQPGVTQGKLHQFLIENGYDYMVPTTGAGPNCSLMGNALERGYGITPYADHFAAVTSMEVVLANGELYKSYHADIGAKSISTIYKWGLGPYIEGLFSQGSYGIVTEMSILLSRRPESLLTFVFELTFPLN